MSDLILVTTIYNRSFWISRKELDLLSHLYWWGERFLLNSDTVRIEKNKIFVNLQEGGIEEIATIQDMPASLLLTS